MFGGINFNPHPSLPNIYQNWDGNGKSFLGPTTQPVVTTQPAATPTQQYGYPHYPPPGQPTNVVVYNPPPPAEPTCHRCRGQLTKVHVEKEQDGMKGTFDTRLCWECNKDDLKKIWDSLNGDKLKEPVQRLNHVGIRHDVDQSISPYRVPMSNDDEQSSLFNQYGTEKHRVPTMYYDEQSTL